MTDTAALRALIAGATKELWRIGYNDGERAEVLAGTLCVIRNVAPANAALIVAAVNSLGPLLDELDALRACVKAADAMARPMADHGDTDAYLALRAATLDAG